MAYASKSNKTYLNTKSKLGMTLAKRKPSRPSRVGRNRNERLVTEPLLLENTLKYTKKQNQTNNSFKYIPFTIM